MQKYFWQFNKIFFRQERAFVPLFCLRKHLFPPITLLLQAFSLTLRRTHVYSNKAIEASLTIGAVFGLPLYGTQGFVGLLFALLRSELRCPDYNTLCRRREGLNISIPPRKGAMPLVIAIDSTGLKVYGEGEWKVRKHGASKRRTWRKLHLAVDVKTNEIVASVLTTNLVAF